MKLSKKYLVTKTTTAVFKVLNEGEKNIINATIEEVSSKQIVLVRILGQVMASMGLNCINVIQARLVVQTSKKGLKKYNGAIDCLKKIEEEEEGGIIGSVFGRTFTISALYHTVIATSREVANYVAYKSFFKRVISVNGVNRRSGGLSAILGLFVAQVLIKTVELVIALPLETIANRMYVQQRYKAHTLNDRKKYTSIVPLSPTMYNGLCHGFQRICYEEGHPRKKKLKLRLYNDEQRPDKKKLLGLSGLYKDFSFRWVSSFAIITYSAVFNSFLS